LAQSQRLHRDALEALGPASEYHDASRIAPAFVEQMF
jgi:hypothetical protein